MQRQKKVAYSLSCKKYFWFDTVASLPPSPCSLKSVLSRKPGQACLATLLGKKLRSGWLFYPLSWCTCALCSWALFAEGLLSATWKLKKRVWREHGHSGQQRLWFPFGTVCQCALRQTVKVENRVDKLLTILCHNYYIESVWFPLFLPPLLPPFLPSFLTSRNAKFKLVITNLADGNNIPCKPLICGQLFPDAQPSLHLYVS